jgi:hypothetical protein
MDRRNPAAGQLEEGRAWERRSRVESGEDGPVLVVDWGFGPIAKCDSFSAVTPRWHRSVEHLAKIGMLTLRKNGREWKLGYGPKALKVRQGPLAAKKATS